MYHRSMIIAETNPYAHVCRRWLYTQLTARQSEMFIIRFDFYHEWYIFTKHKIEFAFDFWMSSTLAKNK